MSGCPPTMRRQGFLISGLGGMAISLFLLAANPVMAGPPDAWVTGKVKIALFSELVDGPSVDVDTFDGRVTLHGKVRSEAERAEADRLARNVSGVRDVRNLLQVVPTNQRKAVAVADDRLKDRVSHKLKGDRALSNSSIAVKSVHAGVVLLNGRAHTLSDHLRALELASRVPGVQRVASEIESPEEFADSDLWYGDAPPRGSATRAIRDAWLTSRIKLAFMTDPTIPASDISVDTENGRVTLFGIVPSLAARDAAARIARKTGDVLSVKNDLRIISDSERSRVKAEDRELEATIRARLAASGFAPGVEVDVKAGVARLSGKVGSWADRYAVLTVARNTDGIRAVRDDLTVATAHASR